MTAPTKSKRLVFTLGDNPLLLEVIDSLEQYYKGMTKVEILKMALIDKFHQIPVNTPLKKTVSLSKKSGTAFVGNSKKVMEFLSNQS